MDGKCVALILSILVILTPSTFAGLPKWVRRVESCPNPGNISLWIEESKKLNCYHHLSSDDPKMQEKVYHCLPSSFLNETVEFCGRNVPVEAGKCPVYSYAFSQNVGPHAHNCSKFSSGCPKAQYFSKDAYKYPECLKINKRERCFEAEFSCRNSFQEVMPKPNGPKVTEIDETDGSQVTVMPKPDGPKVTEIDKTDGSQVTVMPKPDGPEVTEIDETDGSQVTMMGITHESQATRPKVEVTMFSTDSDIFLVVLSATMLLLGILLGFLIVCLKKRWQCKSSVNGFKLSSDERNGLLNNGRPSASKDSEDNMKGLANGNDTSYSINEMKEKARLYEYNKPINDLINDMTEEECFRIKRVLEDSAVNTAEERELDKIRNPRDLLQYLKKRYSLPHSMVFVQGLLLASKVNRLYQKCVDIAKSWKQEPIIFFEQKPLETDYSKVEYIFYCPDKSTYTNGELENLFKIIMSFTGAKYNDIKVCKVKEGCVHVTLMIRNNLVPALRSLYSPEDVSKTCQMMSKSLRHRINKVLIQDVAVYTSDDASSTETIIRRNTVPPVPKNHNKITENKDSRSLKEAGGDRNEEYVSDIGLCAENITNKEKAEEEHGKVTSVIGEHVQEITLPKVDSTDTCKENITDGDRLEADGNLSIFVTGSHFPADSKETQKDNIENEDFKNAGHCHMKECTTHMVTCVDAEEIGNKEIAEEGHGTDLTTKNILKNASILKRIHDQSHLFYQFKMDELRALHNKYCKSILRKNTRLKPKIQSMNATIEGNIIERRGSKLVMKRTCRVSSFSEILNEEAVRIIMIFAVNPNQPNEITKIEIDWPRPTCPAAILPEIPPPSFLDLPREHWDDSEISNGYRTMSTQYPAPPSFLDLPREHWDDSEISNGYRTMSTQYPASFGDYNLQRYCNCEDLGTRTLPSGIIGFIPESTRKRNERRHVLLEKTGCGKSATGNTILRSGRFRTMISGLNVIHACSQNFTDRFNRRIVVDTPGILDAEETNEIIQDQLDAKNIITEECLMICPSILRRFNENCGNRVLTFDNNLEGLEQNEQVQTLFDILLEIVKRDHVNTIDMYTEAEKKIMLVEEEKLQDEKEKLEEELKRFDQKHAQAIGGLIDQVQELSRKQDREEREIGTMGRIIKEDGSKIPTCKSTQSKEVEHELAVMCRN
ncbi:uncharacterized protein LOC111108757 isoform X1 [Crassostrea virginica]